MRGALSFLASGLFFAVIIYGMVRLSAALTLRAGRRAKAEVEGALARAVPAAASVLRVRQPKGLMRRPRAGSVRLLLTLEVRPAAGAPYEAEAMWQVDMVALPELRPGLHVAVRVDADEPTTVYPAEPWATYDWP